MESQFQNPELGNNPENFHPCKFSCFYCCLLTFFKMSFFEEFFQKHYQSVTIWIQIRPYIMLGLIWVQPFVKVSRQQKLPLAKRELNKEC